MTLERKLKPDMWGISLLCWFCTNRRTTAGYFEVSNLNNLIYCCGYMHECRTYCIGGDKYLQFIDGCCVCDTCIAQIVKVIKGKYKIIVRKTNKQAIQLFERYLTSVADFKEHKGTYSNLFVFYNNRGDIYNFNNQKVGTNEQFCASL